MGTFVTTVFVLYCISTLISIANLAFANYPRVEKKSRVFDAVLLVIMLGMAVWSGVLVF